MPLTVGQSLSFYEILGPLGAGGMGEVYRAKDTRLEREVAIKVLPEHFAQDEERLQRFQREAKTLASLNHPNVAGIHGVDRDGDVCFLALELVPGEDLAERLARGPLPADEAIDVCRQIAEGLEAAHEAGVVHRDLKPANIRVTPEGVVKVLDFGLAKSMRTETSAQETLAAESDSFLMTEDGLVLGTPTYMSPEQARGKPVDRRTDIWAFGCVLYECLTGKRAFSGDSLTDVLASIIEREPDWSRVPAGVGADVRRLLRRCLAKDARVRLRDAGEARISLGGEAQDLEAEPVPGPTSRPRAAFVAGLVIASSFWFAARVLFPPAVESSPHPTGNALHFTIDRPPGAGMPRLSPDGSRILYAAAGRLWVQDLAQLEPVPVPGTEGAAAGSSATWCWSTDGESIAFARDGFLQTLRLGESRAERRCALSPQVVNCAWADNGAFLFEIGGKSEGIYWLPPGADVAERLDWLDPEQLGTPHRFNPSFLPGGDEFLLTISSHEDSWIHGASLVSRSTWPVVRGRSRAAYVEPGWIAWVDEGKLLVQAFDIEESAVFGTPHELVAGVSSFASTGTAEFSFSSEQALIYRPQDGPSEVQWIDRQGRVLGPAAEPRPYAAWRLDRTGRWMAASITTPENGFQDIWIVDLERGTPQRLTSQQGWESAPAWSPDGSRIAFVADWIGPPNVYVQRVDGGEESELVPFDNHVHYLGSWSADGASVVYERSGTARDRGDLWVVDIDTLERRVLLMTPASETSPEVSPDGRWIAYTSDESGREEIYVASFPELVGRRRVSAEGGDQARWKADSSELFYLTESRAIASVDIAERNGLPDPGSEVIVIQASADLAQFALTPDENRFLVMRRNAARMRPVSHVITKWQSLLRR